MTIPTPTSNPLPNPVAAPSAPEGLPDVAVLTSLASQFFAALPGAAGVGAPTAGGHLPSNPVPGNPQPAGFSPGPLANGPALPGAYAPGAKRAVAPSRIGLPPNALLSPSNRNIGGSSTGCQRVAAIAAADQTPAITTPISVDCRPPRSTGQRNAISSPQ